MRSVAVIVVDAIFRILLSQGRDPSTVTLDEAKQLTLSLIRHAKAASCRNGEITAADLHVSENAAVPLYSAAVQTTAAGAR